MSLTRQTIVSVISHAVSICSLLLVQILIARNFGPDGRGVFANVFAISSFLVLSLGTGHGVANAYLVASGKQKIQEAAGSSVLGVIVSLLLISLAVAYIMYFRPSFVTLASNRVLFWAFLIIPFNLMAVFSSGILRGAGRTGEAYWYYGILNSSWLVGVFVFCVIFSLKRLEVVFVCKIIAEIIALLLMLFFLRSEINFSWLRPQFKKFRESICYSIKFYFTRIVNPMVVRVEIIIIPMLLLDKAALGLYAQAFAVLSQIMVISNVVGYVLMPQVAKNAVASVQLTAQVCRMILTVTLLLGVAVMFASKYLVPLVFGKDFSPIVPLMWIMFFGLVVRSISKILYHYFQGANKPFLVSMFYFISLIIMIGIDIALVPRIGIKGAAIGTLISCISETLMFSIAFIRISKVKWIDVFVMQSEDWRYLSGKCFSFVQKVVRFS